MGHSNGSFYLVLVSGGDDWGPETTGIDLRMGARMMADMGCDYALNMDGGELLRKCASTGSGLIEHYTIWADASGHIINN